MRRLLLSVLALAALVPAFSLEPAQARAEDRPSVTPAPMSYGQEPADIAPLNAVRADGHYGAVGMRDNGHAFAIDTDNIRLSGPPGRRIADILFLEIAPAPIHDTTFRATRARIDCAEYTYVESASRLFRADGRPLAWLPAPVGDQTTSPSHIWQMMITVACGGAAPAYSAYGFDDLLRQTRARTYADADFVGLPRGRLGLVAPPQAGRREVRLMALDGRPRSGQVVVEVSLLTLNPGGGPGKYGSAYAVTRLRIDCAARSVFTLGGAGYDGVGEVKFNILADAEPKVLAKGNSYDPVVDVACGRAQPLDTVTGYGEAMRRYGADTDLSTPPPPPLKPAPISFRSR